MKRNILKVMMVIFLFLVVSPVIVRADDVEDVTDYAVTITVKHTDNQNNTKMVFNILFQDG